MEPVVVRPWGGHPVSAVRRTVRTAVGAVGSGEPAGSIRRMLNTALSPLGEPLDSRRLQQFLCVAEVASFSRAAERLHVSQQALSSSVAKLEGQLGVSLFDRSGRQVRLTAAGEALRAGASVLLAAGQVLARQVRDAAAAQQRPFVVAHTPAITG